MPSRHHKPESSRQWRGRSYRRGASLIRHLRYEADRKALVQGEPETVYGESMKTTINEASGKFWSKAMKLGDALSLDEARPHLPQEAVAAFERFLSRYDLLEEAYAFMYDRIEYMGSRSPEKMFCAQHYNGLETLVYDDAKQEWMQLHHIVR